MLVQVGADFQTSSLDAIGRARARTETASASLERLAAEGITEIAVLSTCNRFEMYAAAADADRTAHALELEAASVFGPEDADLEVVVRRDRAAIGHLVAVAAGLESALLGEYEILGQVRRAYVSAAEAGTASTELARAFEHALRHGRRIRSTLGISGVRRSLADVAVEWVASRVSDVETTRAGVVGAGEVGSQIVRGLASVGVRDLVVLNRNVAAARKLAAATGAIAEPLARLTTLLSELDVVVLATSSPIAIVGEPDVRRGLADRPHRPLHIVDLGLPPNASPAVAEHPSLELLSLSDALRLAMADSTRREIRRERADELVRAAVDEFTASQRVHSVGPVLTELRVHLEETIVEESEAILASEGHSPLTNEEMRRFAVRLSRRLLHAPTEGVREIAARESPERAESVVRALFFRR